MSAVLIAVSGIVLLGLRLQTPLALATTAEPASMTGVRAAECPLHPPLSHARLARSVLSFPHAPRVAEGSCEHCGLPLPSVVVLASDGKLFCCNGCSTVYAAIQGAGLGAFYEEREFQADERARGRPSGRSFSELDDEEFARTFERHPDGSVSVELQLEGVHCAACVWMVESLPRVASGAREARLDFGRAVANLRWDPRETQLSALATTLDRFGYTPHALGRGQRRETRGPRAASCGSVLPARLPAT